MHKLLCRNLTSRRTPSNFTSIYRKVAKHHVVSCNTENDIKIKRNYTDEHYDEENEINIPPESTGKTNTVKLLMRSLFPGPSVASISTASRKTFYSHPTNYKNDSDNKYMGSDYRSTQLYKSGLQQCMKIKYNRQKVMKPSGRICIAPQPYRISNIKSDSKFAKQVKSEEIVAKVKSDGTNYKGKKKIFLEQALPLPSASKKKKFKIVYPTHAYKLGQPKAEKKTKNKLEETRNAGLENLRYVIKDSRVDRNIQPKESERYVVKDSTYEKPNVIKDTKKPNNLRDNKQQTYIYDKLPIDNIKLHSSDHTIEFCPSKTVPDAVKPGTLRLFKKVTDSGKQHISLHPTMKKFNQQGKMAINKKYNAILMKTQKPVTVKPWTYDDYDPQTKKNEEPEVKIMQHPLRVAKKDANSFVNKYSKSIIVDKNEDFNINEMCIKTNEKYGFTSNIKQHKKSLILDKFKKGNIVNIKHEKDGPKLLPISTGAAKTIVQQLNEIYNSKPDTHNEETAKNKLKLSKKISDVYAGPSSKYKNILDPINLHQYVKEKKLSENPPAESNTSYNVYNKFTRIKHKNLLDQQVPEVFDEKHLTPAIPVKTSSVFRNILEKYKVKPGDSIKINNTPKQTLHAIAEEKNKPPELQNNFKEASDDKQIHLNNSKDPGTHQDKLKNIQNRVESMNKILQQLNNPLKQFVSNKLDADAKEIQEDTLQNKLATISLQSKSIIKQFEELHKLNILDKDSAHIKLNDNLAETHLDVKQKKSPTATLEQSKNMLNKSINKVFIDQENGFTQNKLDENSKEKEDTQTQSINVVNRLEPTSADLKELNYSPTHSNLKLLQNELNDHSKLKGEMQNEEQVTNEIKHINHPHASLQENSIQCKLNYDSKETRREQQQNNSPLIQEKVTKPVNEIYKNQNDSDIKMDYMKNSFVRDEEFLNKEEVEVLSENEFLEKLKLHGCTLTDKTALNKNSEPKESITHLKTDGAIINSQAKAVSANANKIEPKKSIDELRKTESDGNKVRLMEKIRNTLRIVQEFTITDLANKGTLKNKLTEKFQEEIGANKNVLNKVSVINDKYDFKTPIHDKENEQHQPRKNLLENFQIKRIKEGILDSNAMIDNKIFLKQHGPFNVSLNTSSKNIGNEQNKQSKKNTVNDPPLEEQDDPDLDVNIIETNNDKQSKLIRTNHRPMIRKEKPPQPTSIPPSQKKERPKTRRDIILPPNKESNEAKLDTSKIPDHKKENVRRNKRTETYVKQRLIFNYLMTKPGSSSDSKRSESSADTDRREDVLKISTYKMHTEHTSNSKRRYNYIKTETCCTDNGRTNKSLILKNDKLFDPFKSNTSEKTTDQINEDKLAHAEHNKTPKESQQFSRSSLQSNQKYNDEQINDINNPELKIPISKQEHMMEPKNIENVDYTEHVQDIEERLTFAKNCRTNKQMNNKGYSNNTKINSEVDHNFRNKLNATFNNHMENKRTRYICEQIPVETEYYVNISNIDISVNDIKKELETDKGRVEPNLFYKFNEFSSNYTKNKNKNEHVILISKNTSELPKVIRSVKRNTETSKGTLQLIKPRTKNTKIKSRNNFTKFNELTITKELKPQTAGNPIRYSGKRNSMKLSSSVSNLPKPFSYEKSNVNVTPEKYITNNEENTKWNNLNKEIMNDTHSPQLLNSAQLFTKHEDLNECLRENIDPIDLSTDLIACRRLNKSTKKEQIYKTSAPTYQNEEFINNPHLLQSLNVRKSLTKQDLNEHLRENKDPFNLSSDFIECERLNKLTIKEKINKPSAPIVNKSKNTLPESTKQRNNLNEEITNDLHSPQLLNAAQLLTKQEYLNENLRENKDPIDLSSDFIECGRLNKLTKKEKINKQSASIVNRSKNTLPESTKQWNNLNEEITNDLQSPQLLKPAQSLTKQDYLNENLRENKDPIDLTSDLIECRRLNKLTQKEKIFTTASTFNENNNDLPESAKEFIHKSHLPQLSNVKESLTKQKDLNENLRQHKGPTDLSLDLIESRRLPFRKLTKKERIYKTSAAIVNENKNDLPESTKQNNLNEEFINKSHRRPLSNVRKSLTKQEDLNENLREHKDTTDLSLNLIEGRRLPSRKLTKKEKIYKTSAATVNKNKSKLTESTKQQNRPNEENSPNEEIINEPNHPQILTAKESLTRQNDLNENLTEHKDTTDLSLNLIEGRRLPSRKLTKKEKIYKTSAATVNKNKSNVPESTKQQNRPNEENSPNEEIINEPNHPQILTAKESLTRQNDLNENLTEHKDTTDLSLNLIEGRRLPSRKLTKKEKIYKTSAATVNKNKSNVPESTKQQNSPNEEIINEPNHPQILTATEALTRQKDLNENLREHKDLSLNLIEGRRLPSRKLTKNEKIYKTTAATVNKNKSKSPESTKQQNSPDEEIINESHNPQILTATESLTQQKDLNENLREHKNPTDLSLNLIEGRRLPSRKLTKKERIYKTSGANVNKNKSKSSEITQQQNNLNEEIINKLDHPQMLTATESLTQHKDLNGNLREHKEPTDLSLDLIEDRRMPSRKLTKKEKIYKTSEGTVNKKKNMLSEITQQQNNPNEKIINDSHHPQLSNVTQLLIKQEDLNENLRENKDPIGSSLDLIEGKKLPTRKLIKIEKIDKTPASNKNNLPESTKLQNNLNEEIINEPHHPQILTATESLTKQKDLNESLRENKDPTDLSLDLNEGRIATTRKLIKKERKYKISAPINANLFIKNNMLENFKDSDINVDSKLTHRNCISAISLNSLTTNDKHMGAKNTKIKSELFENNEKYREKKLPKDFKLQSSDTLTLSKQVGPKMNTSKNKQSGSKYRLDSCLIGSNTLRENEISETEKNKKIKSNLLESYSSQIKLRKNLFENSVHSKKISQATEINKDKNILDSALPEILETKTDSLHTRRKHKNMLEQCLKDTYNQLDEHILNTDHQSRKLSKSDGIVANQTGEQLNQSADKDTKQYMENDSIPSNFENKLNQIDVLKELQTKLKEVANDIQINNESLTIKKDIECNKNENKSIYLANDVNQEQFSKFDKKMNQGAISRNYSDTISPAILDIETNIKRENASFQNKLDVINNENKILNTQISKVNPPVESIQTSNKENPEIAEKSEKTGKNVKTALFRLSSGPNIQNKSIDKTDSVINKTVNNKTSGSKIFIYLLKSKVDPSFINSNERIYQESLPHIIDKYKTNLNEMSKQCEQKISALDVNMSRRKHKKVLQRLIFEKEINKQFSKTTKKICTLEKSTNRNQNSTLDKNVTNQGNNICLNKPRLKTRKTLLLVKRLEKKTNNQSDKTARKIYASKILNNQCITDENISNINVGKETNKIITIANRSTDEICLNESKSQTHKTNFHKYLLESRSSQQNSLNKMELLFKDELLPHKNVKCKDSKNLLEKRSSLRRSMDLLENLFSDETNKAETIRAKICEILPQSKSLHKRINVSSSKYHIRRKNLSENDITNSLNNNDLNVKARLKNFNKKLFNMVLSQSYSFKKKPSIENKISEKSSRDCFVPKKIKREKYYSDTEILFKPSNRKIIIEKDISTTNLTDTTKRMSKGINNFKKDIPKICLPLKSMSDTLLSNTHEEYTTLTKQSETNLKSMYSLKPVESESLDPLSKYKHLKITYMTIKSQDKSSKFKNHSEDDPRVNVQEVPIINSIKPEILQMRFDWLKKLKSEYNSIYKSSEVHDNASVVDFKLDTSNNVNNRSNTTFLREDLISTIGEEKEVTNAKININPNHLPRNQVEVFIKKLNSQYRKKKEEDDNEDPKQNS